MTDQHHTSPLLDPSGQRRAERRRFLQLAGGATAAAGGLALLSACGGGDDDDGTPGPTPTPTGSPTPTPTATGLPDQAALGFALQLEYLLAQYVSYAVSGSGVPAALLTGSGTQGAVTGGAAASLSDPLVAAAAWEIAIASQRRIAYLRGLMTTAVVAQPAINISGGADGAFTAAARAAGVVGAGELFNPYANDGNFLLGAYFLQDVIVTSYKATVPLISTLTSLYGIIGITAAHGYHAGLLRTLIYANPALRDAATRFSDARDGFDGASNIDQGVTGTDGAANVTPADGNGIVFSRASGSVLNVLYLNKGAVSAGGFFPAGLNGDLKASTANP